MEDEVNQKNRKDKAHMYEAVLEKWIDSKDFNSILEKIFSDSKEEVERIINDKKGEESSLKSVLKLMETLLYYHHKTLKSIKLKFFDLIKEGNIDDFTEVFSLEQTQEISEKKGQDKKDLTEQIISEIIPDAILKKAPHSNNREIEICTFLETLLSDHLKLQNEVDDLTNKLNNQIQKDKKEVEAVTLAEYENLKSSLDKLKQEVSTSKSKIISLERDKIDLQNIVDKRNNKIESLITKINNRTNKFNESIQQLVHTINNNNEKISSIEAKNNALDNELKISKAGHENTINELGKQRQKISELESIKNSLEQSEMDLKSQIHSSQGQLDKLKVSLSEKEKSITDLGNQINDLSDQISMLQNYKENIINELVGANFRSLKELSEKELKSNKELLQYLVNEYESGVDLIQGLIEYSKSKENNLKIKKDELEKAKVYLVQKANELIDPPEDKRYPKWVKSFIILIDELHYILSEITHRMNQVNPESPFAGVINRIYKGHSGKGGIKAAYNRFSLEKNENDSERLYQIFDIELGIEFHQRRNLEKKYFYERILFPWLDDVVNHTARLVLYSNLDETPIYNHMKFDGIDSGQLKLAFKKIEKYFSNLSIGLILPELFKENYDKSKHTISNNISFINNFAEKRYYPIYSQIPTGRIFDLEKVGISGVGINNRFPVVFRK